MEAKEAMDRMDELLAATLPAGEVPREATGEERVELLRLLDASRQLRVAGSEAASEANAALPIARARFERFLEAQRPPLMAPHPAVAALAPRRPLLGGLGQWVFAHRMTALSAAAVVAVLAIVGFAGSQALFTGVESASALVLTENDYVQIEGVVVENSGDTLTLASEFSGNVNVVIDDATSLVEGDQAVARTTLAPGTAIVVDGVVAKGRRVKANTVALGARSQQPPGRVTVRELKSLRPGLNGTVASLSLSPDGARARVLIETPSGEHLLVTVNAASAERLLGLTTALGATISVGGGVGEGFEVRLSGAAEAGPARPGLVCPERAESDTRPRLTGICGVIIAIAGLEVTVRSRDGAERVVAISRNTRIVLGQSEIRPGRLLEGKGAIGNTVAVAGRLEPSTGRILADVLTLGPKPPPR